MLYDSLLFIDINVIYYENELKGNGNRRDKILKYIFDTIRNRKVRYLQLSCATIRLVTK